jgi:hypothetical protein
MKYDELLSADELVLKADSVTPVRQLAHAESDLPFQQWAGGLSWSSRNRHIPEVRKYPTDEGRYGGHGIRTTTTKIIGRDTVQPPE